MTQDSYQKVKQQDITKGYETFYLAQKLTKTGSKELKTVQEVPGADQIHQTHPLLRVYKQYRLLRDTHRSVEMLERGSEEHSGTNRDEPTRLEDSETSLATW